MVSEKAEVTSGSLKSLFLFEPKIEVVTTGKVDVTLAESITGKLPALLRLQPREHP